MLLAALALAGCGGGIRAGKRSPAASATSTSSLALSSPPGEVLSIPSVGRFYGRCPFGARSWTLRFVAGPIADDDVTYRLADGPARRVDVRPRGTLTWELSPRAFRSRQPPDPLTRSPGGVVRTTSPLRLTINQGTEPHILRVDATIALAPALGDTADCELVASRLSALTYYNGGSP
jgi:hypothetical protein